MRSVSYKEVLRRTAAAMGWDPDKISAQEQVSANYFIQRRVEFALESFFWPELCLVEKRAFRTAWVAGTYPALTQLYHRASRSYYVALTSTSLEPATLSGSVYVTNTAGWALLASYGGVAQVTGTTYSSITVYVRGNRVYYPDTDKTYQMHAATAAAGTAPTDTTKWGEVPDFERTIDYEQTQQADGTTAAKIGQVAKIWNRNPRTDRTACKIEFDLQDNGVRVYGSDPVVWVKFLKRCPIYAGSGSAPWLWDGAVSYAVDYQVYDPTTGDFYRSLAGSNQNNAVSDATKWERQYFPRILCNYVAQGASGDLKGKAEGSPEVYPNEAEEAYQILASEFDKIERMQEQGGQLVVW